MTSEGLLDRSEVVLRLPDSLLCSVQLSLLSWDCCSAGLVSSKNLVLLPFEGGSLVSEFIGLRKRSCIEVVY